MVKIKDEDPIFPVRILLDARIPREKIIIDLIKKYPGHSRVKTALLRESLLVGLGTAMQLYPSQGFTANVATEKVVRETTGKDKAKTEQPVPHSMPVHTEAEYPTPERMEEPLEYHRANRNTTTEPAIKGPPIIESSQQHTPITETLLVEPSQHSELSSVKNEHPLSPDVKKSDKQSGHNMPKEIHDTTNTGSGNAYYAGLVDLDDD